jgi:hypothetical protein
MNAFPHRQFASLARRLGVLGCILAIGAAFAPAASAWSPAEAAPELNPGNIQPDSSMRLREDDSAVYLARGLDVGSDDLTQLVVRPPAGPAAFASPFGGGFGQYTTTGLLLMSPLDAFGNLLAIRQGPPYNAAFLAPGANPAGIAVETTPARVSHVDVAPSGEAAAIVGGGSTASVSFRAAGPDGRFDTPRSLDRAGNQRSYGLGITVDPDGGVFVVYRTEQAEVVLQAYAPPGQDFGPPEQIDIPTGTLAIYGWEPIFAQSTNGRGMLVWSESTGGNNNAEQIWAATRAPGGLLGPKSLVAEVPVGNNGVSETAGGITDDGTQYIAYNDYTPVSGCPTNIDGDAGSVLAVRSGGGAWSRTPEARTWPNRTDIWGGSIVTSGNRVGVAIQRSVDVGARCNASDPSSTLSVRLGVGASLGPEVTVAQESITGTDEHGASVTPDGFAVNSRGGAILLSDVPQADGNRKRFLHFQSSSEAAAPVPKPKPLPAPGKILISGKTLAARGGKVPFEASCARLGPGDKIYCHVAAIAMESGPKVLNQGLISKAKGNSKKKAKKKPKAKKPKVLGRAKQVKIAPGKRGKVTLSLNKAGKRQLARAGKKGLKIALRVTIRKGKNVATIERKVTLKAGKPKKKGKSGKGKPKKKR